MTRASRIGIVIVTMLACAMSARTAHAQTALTGTVTDAEDGSRLQGVHVTATDLGPDSTFVGSVTDSTGHFRMTLRPGTYRLRISYVGFIPHVREVEVDTEPVSLGRIDIQPDTELLDEVVVEEMQERVRLRGDTTVYNAAAYRVNPDASTEDLVRKMPGVVIQDGAVQAQGEDVRRVLVDGEEFFGDDPLATLRNLPAEIVQEIEVYDRQSDQARFTGFDDGDEEKTINVVTRPDRRNGQFGRAFGGYGTDSHYLAGAAVNVFDGSRRMTFIGLTNDVNQQNFSTEDLLGVLGSSGGAGRGGGGGGVRRGGSGGGGGGSFRGGGGGNPRDYLVGEQDGISRTSSFGFNYIDRWGEDVRVNGSYFFNASNNDNETGLEREYFLSGGANQLYHETNESESGNANHRLNMRIEAQLSEATELTVRPRLSIQQNSSSRVLGSVSSLADGTLLSQGLNLSESDQLGYDASTEVGIRHRFAARGRTFSANVGIDLDGRRGDSIQDVETIFHVEGDSVNAFEREVDDQAGGRTVSGRIAYTEPLGENGMLQLDYRPSLSTGLSDQDAFRLDPATGVITVPDLDYTTDSDRRVLTQRGGVSYRHNVGRTFRASASLDVQHERLAYEQSGNRAFEVDQSYLTFLPSARISADLSERVNVGVNYRSRTSTPGANQLRDVIDDSNPLLISTGNPDLATSTSHSFDLRFRATNPESAGMFFGLASFSTTRDYVGTASVVAERDSVIVRGIELEPGAQLSYPVNLDGQWNARTFVTYGRPIGILKSNANASVGMSYRRTPSLINDVVNEAGAFQVDGRLFLGSNISERLDFSMRYDLSYTTLSNSSTFADDDAYARHRAGADLTWMPWGGLVLTSSFNLSHYAGLSDDVDPTTTIWNAGVGYKFLRNDLAEVRLSVNDILNENTSVYRSVTGSYVEDRQTEALGRYFMLSINYKLRHFGL